MGELMRTPGVISVALFKKKLNFLDINQRASQPKQICLRHSQNWVSDEA